MSEEEHKKTIDDQLSKYSFLPTLSDAKKYWTMAIIDGSADRNAILNSTLNPENSLYIDQILFVFYKQIPKHITTQLLQFASDEHKQFLPENVCIVKEEEYQYISLMIGAFLTRSLTKVIVFGDDDFDNKFRSFSDIFKNQSQNNRLEFRKMIKLSEYQENDFFVSITTILAPEINEIVIMRQVIQKLHSKFQTQPEQIPQEIFKFANYVLNIVKGIAQKSKIETNNKQIEKIAIQIQILSSRGFKNMNTNKEESKSQRQDNNFISVPQIDNKSPQQSLMNIDQLQSYQQPQQQVNTFPEQLVQQQLQQQLQNQQQVGFNGIKQEWQGFFQQLVNESNKKIMSSLRRANIPNIKKIKNLISSFQNYFNNEIKSRLNVKTILDVERQFLEEIKDNENVKILAALNILCSFKKYGLMVIDNNQYSFNLQVYDQDQHNLLIQNQFKTVTYSFNDAEEFLKQPLQYLQSFQGEPSLLQQQFNNKPQDQMQYATAQIPYQPYMIPMHMQGQPYYYYQPPPGYPYVIPQPLPPGQIPQNVGMPPVYQMPVQSYGSFPQQQYIPQMQVMAQPPYQQYPISQQQMMAAPGYQAPPMMIPQEIQKDQQNQQQLNQVQKKRI